MSRGRMRRNRILAVATAGLLVLAACGDDGETAAETTTTEAPPTTEATTTTTLPPDTSWIAETNADVSQLAVYAEPPQPGDPEPTEPCGTWNGGACLIDNPKIVDNQGGASPLVLLVDGLDVEGDWLPVWLPIPPNESRGFVHRDNVTLYNHSYRIRVDQTAHTLTLTQSGEPIVETQVGLGRAGRETPPGYYYTTELLQAPNPNGAYGPYAYGISGFAEDPDVIAEFGGADGVAVLGIHGTNQPELIGEAVSSGCIRVHNDVITEMATTLPLGVPVEVV